MVIHATTILAVRHQERTCLAGDGQVTIGATVLKHGARKIRRLYNESILAGFAGSDPPAVQRIDPRGLCRISGGFLCLVLAV